MNNTKVAVKRYDVSITCSNEELMEIEAPYAIANDELEIKVQEYRELKDDIDGLIKKLSDLKEDICDHIDENEVLIGTGGEILATWKYTKPIKRLNQVSLKEKMPDVYEAFCEVSAPQRRFNVLK